MSLGRRRFYVIRPIPSKCRSVRGVLAMSHWTAMVEGGPVRVNHAAVVIEDTILSFGGYCAAEFDPHNPDKAMDIHAFSTGQCPDCTRL
ncbi:Kelch domain-containing protein 3 [Amphibalanus amphitrite]|uniref:Kelch domain-containing protein 3 n=1 Tax=Amphibalanus amphitrite TaxID=1232801 RepID=A0A6A4WTM6_AMPAM|nr:Kelch domain-containing protein 3 [Amphibalanus amphitrite]